MSDFDKFNWFMAGVFSVTYLSAMLMLGLHGWHDAGTQALFMSAIFSMGMLACSSVFEVYQIARGC